jgi:hypothetical protein
VTLEERLSEMGVFKARYVAVIGSESMSQDVAQLCLRRGNEVLMYGRGQEPLNQGEYSNYFVLSEEKGQNRWANLNDASIVIILKCNLDIIEEILFAVKPFSLVIVIGPIDGAIKDMDFYSTVHLKNLELRFLSLPSERV